MIEYYVEKGIHWHNVMAKTDKQKSFVCTCKFKENAEKIADILNDDVIREAEEKPWIYKDLDEVIGSE